MKPILLALIINLICSIVGYAANPVGLIGQDHPLSNKIWDVTAKRFVSQDEVKTALLEANYIFLGETHDNPLHHQLQNWALIELLSANKKPGVAFEMIDNSQMKNLDLDKITSADALFDAIDWDKSGWPSRDLYRNIFQIVIESDLPIYSANYPHEALRDLITQIQDPSEEITQILEQRPLSAEEAQSMLKELEESHCYMLPERYVAGMIIGQRLRDAIMAQSLLNHSSPSPAVLISGKAHARLDRGAPSFIRQRQPKAKIVSIGWHEVEIDRLKPSDYTEIWHSDSLPFDYVWFTAKVDRPNPCDEIKHFLNKQLPTATNPSNFVELFAYKHILRHLLFNI